MTRMTGPDCAVVCVCVFSSRSFWTSSSVDVPAGGVTQEEGHTGFFIHLLSAVRAFIFLARRIQPSLSLVDRQVEFCVLTISSFSTRWAFLFSFFSFSVRKIPFTGIELTSQRVRGYMVPLSYRGGQFNKYTHTHTHTHINYDDAKAAPVTGTTLTTTDPVPADSRQ